MQAAAFVAVVPIRDGSRGFPGKNTAPLAGRPLYRHAVDQALAAGARHVVVTTDIPEVLEAEHPAGVVLHRRPDALAADHVPMAPVIADVLTRGELAGDPVVVLLQATSPLRTAAQVRDAVDRFRDSGADLLMSVCEADPGVLKHGTITDGRFTALRDPSHPFTNRQQLPPVYRPNGAIYVFRADWFRRHGSLSTTSIEAYEMPVADSIDIDAPADLDRCAARLAARERIAS